MFSFVARSRQLQLRTCNGFSICSPRARALNPRTPLPCLPCDSLCSFVPENVLKKRKARDELAAKAAALRKDEKAAAKVRREGMFKRAEVSP